MQEEEDGRAEVGSNLKLTFVNFPLPIFRVYMAAFTRSVRRALVAVAAALPSVAFASPPPPPPPPQPARAGSPPAADPPPASPTVVAIAPPSAKKHIVVVGSGWASISFLRSLNLDPATHHVTCVSPRGQFLYTPLLPAAVVGSVEARSIVEPVRSLLPPGASFVEAAVTAVHAGTRTITCESALSPGRPFTLAYDVLVLAPGSVANDFGTPGVKEHARVLRSYDDVVGLRRAIHDAWERAALPTTSEAEARRLLTFVLCGGGPTGSELAAELRDLFEHDIGPSHPTLAHLARVVVIDSNSHVLSMFDRAIAEYATAHFKGKGIELVLKSRVTAVTADGVVVLDKATGASQLLPSATVVWATGVGLHPLAAQLARALPKGSQTNSRALVVDDRLRVKGTQGTIYCLGDAATLEPDITQAHAAALFKEFDADGSGTLDVNELTALLEKASKRHPALREHARLFANAKERLAAGAGAGAPAEAPAPAARGWLTVFAAPAPEAQRKTAKSELRAAFARVAGGGALTLDEFKALLSSMDAHLRALPATAQVARQQGVYLAAVANRGELGRTSGEHLATPPFAWRDLGSLAFIGSGEAVAKLPGFGVLQGIAAGLMWRGFETSQQQGMRSKVAVASDQIRSTIFGRGL